MTANPRSLRRSVLFLLLTTLFVYIALYRELELVDFASTI